jgi:hypothetical protein
MVTCEDLKNKMQFEEAQKLIEKQKNAMDLENNVEG